MYRARRQRVFVGAVLLLACVSIWGAPVKSQEKRQPSQPQTQPARATRTVTDETGREVTLPVEVNRIVTLAPSLTETIYALGIEDKLVGDTDYCDNPPAAKLKPHVGSVLSPSMEAIVALHPDLVFAAADTANRLETVESLEHLGIPVYASDPRTVDQMVDSTLRIAELSGAVIQGRAVGARLRARLDALHEKLGDLPLAHVLFVVWENPLITIGPNTFIADALRWAGAESVIVTKQDWPQISIEEVVRLQPDYIVMAATHGVAEAERSSEAQLKEMRERPVWRELHAVQAGHVVITSDEIIRPSPGLIDVIELLARDLHPDAFQKSGATGLGSTDKRQMRQKERVSCGL